VIAAPPARIGKTTGAIPVKVRPDKGGKTPPPVRVKRGAGRPGLINKTK